MKNIFTKDLMEY